MVATSTEALLTADRDLLVVKQVAEELPAGGHLVALQTLCLGNQVDSTGCGHGAGQTVNTLLLEVGNQLGVVGDDGQAVTGGHKGVSTVDHVAVTVTIASGTEVDTVLVNSLNQLMGIDQVGVRVTTVEVRARDTVHGAAAGQTKLVDEDIDAVGPGDTVHAIKQNLEVLVGVEELLDQVEVENLLHHLDIVGGRVDNLHLQGAIGLGANTGKINLGDLSVVIGGEGLGGFVDLVGDCLGGGGTVGQVVLDTKVGIGTCDLALAEAIAESKELHAVLTTGVVAGSQQNATGGLPYTDKITGSGGAQDAVLADKELLDAISGTDLSDLLDGLRVIVTAVATNDEEGVLGTFRDGEEDAGDKGFGVVGLLEDLDLLTKTGAIEVSNGSMVLQEYEVDRDR